MTSLLDPVDGLILSDMPRYVIELIDEQLCGAEPSAIHLAATCRTMRRCYVAMADEDHRSVGELLRCSHSFHAARLAALIATRAARLPVETDGKPVPVPWAGIGDSVLVELLRDGSWRCRLILRYLAHPIAWTMLTARQPLPSSATLAALCRRKMVNWSVMDPYLVEGTLVPYDCIVATLDAPECTPRDIVDIYASRSGGDWRFAVYGLIYSDLASPIGQGRALEHIAHIFDIGVPRADLEAIQLHDHTYQGMQIVILISGEFDDNRAGRRRAITAMFSAFDRAGRIDEMGPALATEARKRTRPCGDALLDVIGASRPDQLRDEASMLYRLWRDPRWAVQIARDARKHGLLRGCVMIEQALFIRHGTHLCDYA